MSTKTTPEPASTGLEQRMRSVGAQLAEAFSEVLAALPGAPHRPNPLARELGVNRAVTSKLLGAVVKADPLEVLHLVPGPEPLRKVLAKLDPELHGGLLERATASVDALARLIDEEAGTRPALDALICPHLPAAREKLELGSRYSIFKGISQLKGVQAQLWLGAAVVTPSATVPDRLDLTWLNGAHALQRLRPGVEVGFSYRFQREGEVGTELQPTGDDILPLERFCIHPPARLEARQHGESIHYRLPDDLLGPKARTDLFVVDHHPASMRRYAAPEALAANRHRTGLFVEPAVPVAQLQFDVILHDEVFPGAEPELYFYDTGYNGVANVNDPQRDHDRVEMVAHTELLGQGLGRFDSGELSTYGPMLAHLAERFGWEQQRLRGYRLSLHYPVFGWQVSMAFQQPPAPR
jgi:hypothetical protein